MASALMQKRPILTVPADKAEEFLKKDPENAAKKMERVKKSAAKIHLFDK